MKKQSRERPVVSQVTHSALDWYINAAGPYAVVVDVVPGTTSVAAGPHEDRALSIPAVGGALDEGLLHQVFGSLHV